MAIWKITASDGSIVWKMNYGTAGTVTGLESVSFLGDGSVIVGGYTDSEDAFAFFKSSGIVTEGKPFIAKISASDAAGSSAPSSFDWTYSMSDSIYTGSTKSIRIQSDSTYANERIFAVVGATSSAVKLEPDGTEVWKTGVLSPNIQINDLELTSAPGTDGLVLVGHEYSK